MKAIITTMQRLGSCGCLQRWQGKLLGATIRQAIAGGLIPDLTGQKVSSGLSIGMKGLRIGVVQEHYRTYAGLPNHC